MKKIIIPIVIFVSWNICSAQVIETISLPIASGLSSLYFFAFIPSHISKRYLTDRSNLNHYPPATDAAIPASSTVFASRYLNCTIL